MEPSTRFWNQLFAQHRPVDGAVPPSLTGPQTLLHAKCTLAEAALARLQSISEGFVPHLAPQAGFVEMADDATAAQTQLEKALSLLRDIPPGGPFGDCDATRGILQELGPLGVARILGCRLTKGTQAALACGWLPLHPSQLVLSFEALHCEGSLLTVGARALAKHVHRDETASWWGPALTGSEGHKNMLARTVLRRLMDGASWINVHTLPHSVMVYELRVPEGYGARWAVTDDSVVFRGFLEPPDPDGHAKGWVH